MSYDTLPGQLAAVRERIRSAQIRAGGDDSDVRIVAVTKTHPASAVTAAVDAGLADVGENRVQELEEKVEMLGRGVVRWHLIGPLQRNKAKRAIQLFDLIHSLDSLRLARKLSQEAVAAGLEVRALVQINASGEESKSGFSPEEVIDAVGEMAGLPGLRLRGVMTMAPFTAEEGVLRDTFARTRTAGGELARQIPEFTLEHLSMGMSNDFEIAVEEGSTMVRLGTVLFGERAYD